MKVLALDFDGVIADSQYECLIVGFNTYLSFNRNTKMFDGQKITFDNFNGIKEKYKETVNQYKNLRSYVIDAFCYYVIAYIIDKEIEIKNQNQYKQLREKLMIGFYDKYIKCFYNERINLQQEDYGKWLEMEIPFKKIIDEIRKLKKEYVITVATNNRETAIKGFLEKYDINPKIITDSSLSIDKREQINYTKNKLKTNFSNIHFVDDQLVNFPKLSPLGVKCYLATWGYNTKEQREEAKNNGIILLDENNFYEILARK